MSHNNDVVYGMEVFKVMMLLPRIRYYGPIRLVVVYKSPLPRFEVASGIQVDDLSHVEGWLLKEVPRESKGGDQANSDCGVFVRPLEAKAFERHVETLESY